MDIVKFGTALLKTQDLDPVYVGLVKADLPHDQLARLCLAYWCFYHLGAASYLSEFKGKKYWDLMMAAAVNADSPKPKPGERWPRSAERRHFRGVQATAAVSELALTYPKPEVALDKWYAGGTFSSVSQAVKRRRGFGPWIAFKVADMGERVLGYNIDFADCELGIYKDPRQGAALVLHGHWDHPITDGELRKTVASLVKVFRKHTAPPLGDRPVNVQEVETILCKYKSHVKGHYPIGKDTAEVRHGLAGWGDTAEQILKGLP